MLNIKEIIGVFAVILTFVGYVPYIRDILRGTTKPHVFSWLVWSINTGIIYALQVTSGAGPGSWVTLMLVLIMISILLFSLKTGYRNIKKVDILILVFVFVALLLWLVVKQSVISIILLSGIDMLGFLPTIRKSWNDPYSETLSFYVITTFRHGLSLLALAQYNIVTFLFPLSWVVANGLFSFLLLIRLNIIKSQVK